MQILNFLGCVRPKSTNRSRVGRLGLIPGAGQSERERGNVISEFTHAFSDPYATTTTATCPFQIVYIYLTVLPHLLENYETKFRIQFCVASLCHRWARLRHKFMHLHILSLSLCLVLSLKLHELLRWLMSAAAAAATQLPRPVPTEQCLPQTSMPQKCCAAICVGVCIRFCC